MGTDGIGEVQALIFMKKRKKGSSVRSSRAAVAAPREPRGRTAKAKPVAAESDTYTLSAECTVVESVALKSGLLGLLADPAPITLDVSQVQRIDTAGMQLIAAFVREREANGLQVQWQGTAAAFISASRLLGLQPVLRFPDQAT